LRTKLFHLADVGDLRAPEIERLQGREPFQWADVGDLRAAEIERLQGREPFQWADVGDLREAEIERLLLVVGFATAYAGVRHEYGAGLLFAVAISLLGVALFRFAQEVRIGLSEADHYR
jgi:hypothetical protein